MEVFRNAFVYAQFGYASAMGVALFFLTITFAALNFDDVEVNWLFGTWSTPLVVVIAVSFALGAGGGYLAASRRAKRRAE